VPNIRWIRATSPVTVSVTCGTASIPNPEEVALRTMRLHLVSTSGAGGALGGAPEIGYARRRSTVARHSSITKEQGSCSISSFVVGAS
jgi:hypothetical protein